MKKSTLIMILSLVLAVAIGVGSTLAYLQDTDADVNVMTLGSVYITQNEQERDADGKLVPFTPNKPAYPAVYEKITWAPDGEGADVNGTEYLVFDDSVKNVIDKIVTVTNTGKSDAYVRTIVAIEAPDYDANNLIHVNVNADIGNTAWTPVDIGGVKYVYSVFTYPEALAPQETSVPSLVQLFLDKKAKNEDIEKFGETWEVLVISQAVQTMGFEDGKDENATAANEALDAAFGVTNADNVKTWFEGIDEDDIGSPGDKNDTNNPPEFAPAPGDDDEVTFDVPADAYRVNNANELKEAVAAGKTVLLLAAGEYDIVGCKNKELTLIGESREDTVITVVGAGQGEANGQLDYDFDGSNVTFQNLTIKTNNATYAGYARLNGTYKDVIFDNCYCLNGDSVFEYCTFNVAGDQYNVWTWGADSVEFNHCTFNSSGKALLVYGENVTTDVKVDACEFNDDETTDFVKAAIETGSDRKPNDYYTITVTNTVVNGFAINTTNCSAVNSTLWANKNGLDHNNLNVVVDGVDVY